MEEYEEIEPSEAYILQNAGGLVLVCTKGIVTVTSAKAERSTAEAGSDKSLYDLAPVAWCCPLDYEPVSKILLVCDTGHKTYADIAATGKFVIALPTYSQKELVEKVGSVSGRDKDKYSAFGIEAFKAEKVDALIPSGVVGWMECKLDRVIVQGTSGIVIGEVLRAVARPDAWKERLHYVGDELYFMPGRALN
jgi:flavin reductase (DIM6/NTAB) family NADH-FMN oxidoreductase RutF